jgi:branched-subunit amino acid ABC-type transport system permease component
VTQTIIIYGIIWTALNCLIATGFSLLFGVCNVLNLSHGMVIMAASYLVFISVSVMRLPVYASILIGIGGTAIILVILYVGFIRRLLSSPHISQLLLTAGLAIVLQQVIILTVGPNTKFAPSLAQGSTRIWGVVVANHAIVAVVVAALVIGGLVLFLQKTKLGRAVRAVTQDRETASMYGINSEEVFLITIISSGFLAGIAGVLVAPLQTVTPEIGWELMVTAFTVTILAGLGGPIWGIVLSAGIVSYVTLLTAFLIAPTLKEAAAFLIMILTLLFRPSGLFGKGRL